MDKSRNIVCPQCRRSFKTKAALAQHRGMVHGVSGTVRPRPKRRAVGPKRAGVNSSLQPTVLKGSDLVSVVDMPSGTNSTTAGKVLKQFIISPAQFAGSRLQAHSALWSRWRPKSISATLLCGGSMTTFGLVTVAWSPDTRFQVSDSPADTVSRVMALKPNQTVPISGSGMISIPTETTRKWYSCRGEHDDTAHGMVVVVLSAAAGGWQGHLSVNLKIDWVVEFEGIEMNPAAEAGEVDRIKPDAGYEHIFTTSDSSWNSDVLTFKMHSGGDMVPFSSAKPHYIYKPSSGVVATYYDASGTKHNIAYLVVIQGASVPGLAFCSTIDDARAYVRTGDVAKLIKYSKAGDYVTPDIPAFEGGPASTFKESKHEVDDLRDEIVRLRLTVGDLRKQASDLRDEVASVKEELRVCKEDCPDKSAPESDFVFEQRPADP